MSLIFTVKTDLSVEGYDRFISIYRKITNTPLGGTKSIKPYKDPTIANVLSVGVTDNINRLPQRLTLTNFSNYSPITSYGFICRYFSEEKDEMMYLIIRRRESTSYIDLVQGNYRTSQLFLLIKDIGLEERHRLCKHSFDELWKDLRGATPTTTTDVSVEDETYTYSKERFMQIQPHLLELFWSIAPEDPEGRGMYGFPKGRLAFLESGTGTESDKTEKTRESPLACALREFREETNGIDLTKIKYITLSKDPICEKFIGTNNKNYASYYFLVELEAGLQPELSQFPKEETGIRRATTGEVESISWIPASDLHQVLIERRYELVRFADSLSVDLEEREEEDPNVERFASRWTQPIPDSLPALDDFIETSCCTEN